MMQGLLDLDGADDMRESSVNEAQLTEGIKQEEARMASARGHIVNAV